jgi:hypothetical protein
VRTLQENRLRKRLRQLTRYKLMGISTINEGAKYDALKRDAGSYSARAQVTGGAQHCA